MPFVPRRLVLVQSLLLKLVISLMERTRGVDILILTEHRVMQVEGTHFIQQILCHLEIFVIPAVPFTNPQERLRSCQPYMIPIRSTQVQCLVLVKERVRAKGVKHFLLPFEKSITGEEVLGELVDIDGRCIALCL